MIKWLLILQLYLIGSLFSTWMYTIKLWKDKSFCTISDLVMAFAFSWAGVFFLFLRAFFDFLFNIQNEISALITFLADFNKLISESIKKFLNTVAFDFTDDDNE